MLRLLIKLYESVENPDWVSISQCLLLLDDAPEVAKVLERLLKGSEVSLFAINLSVRHRYALQNSLCERLYARLPTTWRLLSVGGHAGGRAAGIPAVLRSL